MRRDTIQKHNPGVCGFLCMDSHSKVVEPCIPSCKNDDQVELQQQQQADADEQTESTRTNGHHHRELVFCDDIVSQELDEEEEAFEEIQYNPFWIITDTLVATLVVLLVTMSVLRDFHVSIDQRTTQQHGLAEVPPPSRDSMNPVTRNSCKEAVSVNRDADVVRDEHDQALWNETHVDT